MHSSPAALERQVSRIHELLERSNECVTWNDHIPDPDNPEQLRQIDVTIHRASSLAVIECRLSRKRQNVKWVEELIGRRESLGAQVIIGVSSAGFTKGAQRKAARFGVLLRDLKELTDQEITNWAQQIALVLYYYQYSNVTLSLGFSPQSIQRFEPKNLTTELRSHDAVQAGFNAAAKQLDTLNLIATEDTRMTHFGVRIRPENDIRLCGEPILELCLEGCACLAAKPISSPWTFRYGEPTQSIIDREVTVQRFTLGETSIVHHGPRIAIDIDLSALELPPLSQTRFFRTTSAEELEHESFAITSPRSLRVTGPMKVELYALRP